MTFDFPIRNLVIICRLKTKAKYCHEKALFVFHSPGIHPELIRAGSVPFNDKGTEPEAISGQAYRTAAAAVFGCAVAAVGGLVYFINGRLLNISPDDTRIAYIRDFNDIYVINL